MSGAVGVPEDLDDVAGEVAAGEVFDGDAVLVWIRGLLLQHRKDGGQVPATPRGADLDELRMEQLAQASGVGPGGGGLEFTLQGQDGVQVCGGAVHGPIVASREG